LGELMARYAPEAEPLAAQVADKGGVTYNPTTGDLHTSGQVTPVDETRTLALDHAPAPEEIHDYLMANQDYLGSGEPGNVLHITSDGQGNHFMRVAYHEPDTLPGPSTEDLVNPVEHQREYAQMMSGTPAPQPGDLAAKYRDAIQTGVPSKYQKIGAATLDPAANMLKPEEYTDIASRQPNVEGFNQIINLLPKAAEMASVAKVGEPKRGWYRASSQAIQDVFGPDDAPRFAGLLAALSPQTSVQSNLQNALKTWTNWEAAGRPTDPAAISHVMGQSVQGSGGEGSVLPAWVNNSVTALTHPDPKNMELSGFKVNSFMNNLLKDTQAVTNDAWMANYGLPSADKLGEMGILTPKQVEGTGAQTVWSRRSGYNAMSARTRQAADLAGVDPENVQESTWSVAKALYELGHGGVSRQAYLDKLGETAPELAAKYQQVPHSSQSVLESGALTPSVINSVPDFGTLMKDPTYGSLLSSKYRDAIMDTPAPTWHDPVPLSTQDESHLQDVARRLDQLGAVRTK
jgi:hypothetical protein